MAFRFESLEIWQLSIEWTKEIFDFCETLPKEVQYSLGNQLRDSGLSTSNNIAEGSGSNSKKDFAHFINIGIRSIYETISGLFVAKKKGYIDEKRFKELYQKGEILSARMRAFAKTLRV